MAKLSARGCWELQRWVKGEAVHVLRSDGKVLFRATARSGYVVLEKTSARLAATPAEWRKLPDEEREVRWAPTVQWLMEHGYVEAVPHVTRFSHEQRNGAYWYGFRRRFGY